MRFLGRRPHRHDPRHLHLSKYLVAPALPPIPAVVDNSTAVADWGMDANDQISDCTCASMDHCEKLWNALAGNPFTSIAQNVIAVYSDITGYDPNKPGTDNGAELINCLKYWQQTGYLGHKVLAYAKVDPTNAETMKAALYLFECLYAGVNLPWTAQDQPVWSVTDPELKGDAAPASWGGHAVPLVKCGPDGWSCVTWGAVQPMTGDFLTTYFDEVWAVVTADAIKKITQLSPAGFNIATLVSDLTLVQR